MNRTLAARTVRGWRGAERPPHAVISDRLTKDEPATNPRHRCRARHTADPSRAWLPLSGQRSAPARIATRGRHRLRLEEGRGYDRRLFLACMSRSRDLAQEQRGVVAFQNRAEPTKGRVDRRCFQCGGVDSSSSLGARSAGASGRTDRGGLGRAAAGAPFGHRGPCHLGSRA